VCAETERKKKKRMTLPKKKEDLEKIVEEVSESHAHEHHHHVASEIDEILEVYEIFIDSLRANVSALEAQVRSQRLEIARLYKVLSKIIEACFNNDEDAKRRALLEASAVVSS